MMGGGMRNMMTMIAPMMEACTEKMQDGADPSAAARKDRGG